MLWPTTISVSDLADQIGCPRAPVILDIRLDEDVDANPTLIPTARRLPYRAIDGHADGLHGQRTVIVCHRGLKLSQGAAALLRAAGSAAAYLDGGTEAWRTAGAPTLPAVALPIRDASGRTRWVTRHRPPVDRLAGIWLVRRFVDPAARLLFVAPDQVDAVADRFDTGMIDPPAGSATAADRSCVDVLADRFTLTMAPLQRLAAVVRAAAGMAGDPVPAPAPGLAAIADGLAAAWPDDGDRAEAALPLFDGLYAWARAATGMVP